MFVNYDFLFKKKIKYLLYSFVNMNGLFLIKITIDDYSYGFIETLC